MSKFCSWQAFLRCFCNRESFNLALLYVVPVTENIIKFGSESICVCSCKRDTTIINSLFPSYLLFLEPRILQKFAQWLQVCVIFATENIAKFYSPLLFVYCSYNREHNQSSCLHSSIKVKNWVLFRWNLNISVMSNYLFTYIFFK